MPFSDAAPAIILFGVVVFLLSGGIKGVLGLGLPLFAVPMMASVLDAPTAVALMAVPATVTNVWQATQGRRLFVNVRRFWSLIVALLVVTAIAAQFLASVDVRIGAVVLAVIVLAFCLVQLLPVRLTVDPRHERWLSPLFGAFGGVLGGLSNLFGPPLTMYLIGLRLPKDEFVAIAGLFFGIGGIPLYAILIWHGILGGETLAASAGATVPAMAGLLAGQWARRYVNQIVFHRLLVIVLFVTALTLLWRGLM